MPTEVKTEINLKAKIIAILEARGLSYDALVSYLGITQQELDRAFEENTLEIRTLELISKELRIPLYSFFRDPNADYNLYGEQFYKTNIWAPQELNLQVEIENLRRDLDKLRFELAKKDLIISSLEDELKTKMK
jgi:transcriptional regulator with XRE-family HTH domain